MEDEGEDGAMEQREASRRQPSRLGSGGGRLGGEGRPGRSKTTHLGNGSRVCERRPASHRGGLAQPNNRDTVFQEMRV